MTAVCKKKKKKKKKKDLGGICALNLFAMNKVALNYVRMSVCLDSITASSVIFRAALSSLKNICM